MRGRDLKRISLLWKKVNSENRVQHLFWGEARQRRRAPQPAPSAGNRSPHPATSTLNCVCEPLLCFIFIYAGPPLETCVLRPKKSQREGILESEHTVQFFRVNEWSFLLYTISAVQGFSEALYFQRAGKPIPHAAGLVLVSMLDRTFHDCRIFSLKHWDLDHLHPFLPPHPRIWHLPICSQYLCVQYLFIPRGMYMRASGICLSVSELLGIRPPRSVFPCLVLVNNAAVNVGVHLSFWGSIFVFSKSILSRAITGSCGSCIYFFRNLHTVCHSGCTNFHSHQQRTVSPRLHTLDPTWCLSLGQLLFQQLWGDSRLWVWLMFPWRWLVMSNNFFCLLAPVCHLWTVSIHIFTPFFIQFFFVLICMSVVCILDISLFSHIWFADIFFLLGQWPFKFLMVSFAVWKISVWCCSTCLFLLLLPLHLVSDLKTLCQNQCRET